MIGTPSAAKKPGDTVRKRARGSSSPFGLRVALDGELEARTEAPASRHGTTVPTATRSTPGSSRDRAGSTSL